MNPATVVSIAVMTLMGAAMIVIGHVVRTVLESGKKVSELELSPEDWRNIWGQGVLREGHPYRTAPVNLVPAPERPPCCTGGERHNYMQVYAKGSAPTEQIYCTWCGHVVSL